MYCLCVNVYCHWVTTQLQLINISYHIDNYVRGHIYQDFIITTYYYIVFCYLMVHDFS